MKWVNGNLEDYRGSILKYNVDFRVQWVLARGKSSASFPGDRYKDSHARTLLFVVTPKVMMNSQRLRAQSCAVNLTLSDLLRTTVTCFRIS